ncbi:unnamed protein product [Albugo candida]|uniref:Uncharacterized protein n=1 Tax=Albugo candida TaxID=65357 RepID=A0A024GSZ4_9STRA|nr:unnamed protein product [Albugo candida]|eukprot:CCI49449.1 unnamed protein product [Albugo candida]
MDPKQAAGYHAMALWAKSDSFIQEFFEDFGHENVGTVVKEIFLARWDKDNGAHGKQHSTSRTDMDIRSVNSILRIGSLKGKFQIVDLHTNDKYASMFSDEHLPLLFYHLGDSKNIALQYLVLLRTRRVSPFSPRTFLSYPIEKLSSSFIVAALAMFYPDVFRKVLITDCDKDVRFACILNGACTCQTSIRRYRGYLLRCRVNNYLQCAQIEGAFAKVGKKPHNWTIQYIDCQQ